MSKKVSDAKLDINDLKSGVYMVRFTANGSVGTSKFIKK